MNKYKAIIFDLDGTLLDSVADVAQSLNQALITYGFMPHPASSYKTFIGRGTYQTVKNAIGDNISDLTINRIVDEYKKNSISFYKNKTKVFDNITELLVWLETHNIPYAILSNKPLEIVKLSINRYFKDRNVFSVNGQQGNLPVKPNPTLALQICTKFSCEPHEVLFVGDSACDMETAKNANMIGVGALWGYGTKQELQTGGAKYLIEDPLNIIGLF